MTSSTIAPPRSPAFSPDSKWLTFVKQDATGRSHVYVAPAAGGEERHIADDDLAFSEGAAVWTGDGRYIAYTVSAGTASGVASTGGRATTQMQLMALPLRAQEKDPLNKDIDNEEQAIAAAAAERGGRAGGGGGAGGGAAAPVEVRIDWDGLTRRARRIEVSGDMVSGLTAAPTGSTIAFMASSSSGGGPGGADAAGMYTVNVADGSAPVRVPSAPPSAESGGGRGAGGGGRGGGGGMAFTSDGRTLYFRSGRGIYSAPVGGGGGAAPSSTSAAAGGRGGRGGAAPAAASATPAAAGATARQVTFTINMELDRKAQRRQVFEEGWRVMKNRFYDARMHGADWNAARLTYGALLDNVADQRRVAHGDDADDWRAERVAHGRERRGRRAGRHAAAPDAVSRIRDSSRTRPGTTRWSTSGRAGPPTTTTSS